jgi:predicted nucleic acid-binding protein
VIAAVKDESDNRVLEAAVEGPAPYIVSGEEHLLGLGTFQRTPIVNPAQLISAGLDS